MMGGEDTLPDAAPNITAEQIRESVRRTREEDRKPYVSIFDHPKRKRR
jgi:hypothetical protein